jgi:cytochrome c biogenesis protein CcmG, thiol:disulfide interchange protein DsbE
LVNPPGSRLWRVRRVLPIALALAVIAVLVIGLSQAGSGGSEDPGPDFDIDAALSDLDGAPAPLAALHADHGRLIDGGLTAFRARLRELRGHPVVVNKWASWCGPCRAEFPVFQRVATARGREVAFLGIDGARDPRSDAAEFLREFPVPYPSYLDPNEKISRAIGVPTNYPITLFLDERGETAFIHQGQYRTQADLERDIERYLDA